MAAASFDRIARAYHWLEYLSFGPLLQRARLYWLPQTAGCKHALVLGDGDGRFLARLLLYNPQLHAEAVDASSAMLGLLQQRASAAGPAARLNTRCQDIRDFTPASQYDLVASHFFLDCLTTEEATALASRIRPCLFPEARWIVTDFAVPAGKMALPARLLVRSLYAAFGVLTGLPVRQLPNHSGALQQAGFRLVDRKEWVGGLLFSELWKLEATA
jgi:cyclopropane fatty-acyl-phospholipid synthase-like methyltransferase